MLFSTLARAAAVASAATAFFASPALAQGGNSDSDEADHGQSTFVSESKNIAFALTAPRNAGRDLWFSMRVHTSRSWGAIGLGQEGMEGSLIFMMHRDASGDGVTFSTRLAKGNFEPEYFEEPDIEVETSVIKGDYMVFEGRCHDHCRSWPGGALDITDSNQKAIYAVGPKGSLRYDRKDAPLTMHREYGVFHIDMRRTNGEAETPHLDDSSTSRGTTLVTSSSRGRDLKATFHAIFGIFAVLGLLPAGVLIINLGGWVRWHVINQSVAFLLVTISFALGIACSMNYQRSRGFNDPHQIIGIIIMAFFFTQFALGYFHHKQFKKTQLPTKLALPHRMFGHMIISIGIANAYLGFAFALNRQYQFVLIGLTLMVVFIVFGLMFGKRWLMRRRSQNAEPDNPFASGAAYGQQPWRQQPGANAAPQAGWGVASPPPYPGYQAPPQSSPSIGLSNMSPQPQKASGYHSDMETAQKPRDMV